MKIAFNPSTVAALTTPPNNKDITFDLRGRNIFARGVKFYGTDTNTWRPVVDNLTSNSTTSSLSANQGRVLKALIDGKSDSGHNHDGRYVRYYAVTTLDCNNLAAGLTAARVSATNAAHTNNSVYLYISDIGTPFQIQIPDSNVPYIYKRYYSSGKWSGWFKLNAGYADSAGSVAWANITGKPSSYTPSAHTHAWNSLTHSSTTENQAILTNGKANGWKLYTLNISGWNNAANNAHSHANKSVLDGITSGLVNNWNTAYTFVHTITGTDTDKVINKWDEIVNFLAGITEDNKLNTLLNSKLSVYELADKTNVGTIKNNGIYYSTTDASSGTLTNSPFNTGFALINMTSYDGGDDLRRSRLAFNAFGEIKVSDDRGQSNTAETWYNVLTSKNSGISGSTIKLNGTSITVYSSGTADGRYVKKSGDTMTGVLTIDTTNFGTLTIKRNNDADGASIQFRGKSSVYGYIGLNNSTKDKQFLRWNSDISKVYTILDTSSTYTSSGKGVINGTTITQVDNATNATNSTNARKLVNWYSARPTSLNTQFGDGSLRIFHATSSTTEGKPAEDSHILHLAWDNTGGWDAQLAVHTRSGKVSTRAQNGGTWQPWKTLAFTTDIPSSLKNPHSLTLKANGTTLATYDGSSVKEANFTYANVGAASASHTHSYYAVNENYGGFKKAERLPTSGFYQSIESESGGNAPWTNWMHLINCQHSNTTNNYALQIAASFFNNNIFKIRVTNNSVNNAWRDIIHSGNIGSQSVNYANSAGNSDKVDGYHATSSNKPWGTIPVITTSGWMDIGKHLEFHFDNTTGSDYSTILRCTGNHSNIVNLPSVAGTLALISDIPSSVKNPYSLTTFGVVYDGSSAKVVSPSNFINQLGEGTSVVTDGTMLITSYASNSGFADTNAVNIPYKRKAVHLWEYIKAKTDSLYATKSHNHDERYVYNYGGTAANGQTLNQNALFMSTTSGITGDWWHILQAAWNGEYRWNSQIAFPTQNRNGMYYRSGLDDNTKWGSWVKLLDVNNYSSTLDSRYYTESEVNSLLSKKLDRVNLSVGSWNPRGYSLAADYHYNGGDLSISENGGKMYVSIDGQFYQNEGQYRVLDTSDIGSIRGGLTLYQYLSSTDTNWFPLIWGGSDHKNTNNSTGSLYKSYDKLSWQTSSQTLYATNIQTENIKHLSIGGGIYWNPYVESATGGSDAASITLVKSGVAGGTTLVLSQMNDANDTIQFKTSTTAKLYHNSYPILTTQNTYVNNHKGYIYGTEITQVNNSNSSDRTRALRYSGTGSSEITAYQTDSSYMGRSGWASYIICNHGDGSKYYSQTIAMPFWGSPIYRRLENGTDRGWKKFYTEENPPSWDNVINKPSSFTPSSHTHTWASITDKLVAGNEFNIVNAGFKESMWFNYLPINDRSKTATISSYHFGNGAKGYTSIIASGFIKSGGNASQLLRADGGVAAFNWSGQSGQPTWLWGGNSQHSYYVYNPSNFRVAYAASAGNADTLDGEHANSFATAGHNHDSRYVKIWGNVEANFNFPDGEGHSGVYMCHTTKTQSNKPETYGLLTDFSTVNGHLQFFGASSNKIYTRTYWWTDQDNFKYTDWHTLLHTGNSSVSGHTITINGTSTTWSNSWRPIGTGASDAAAGNHTHKVKINGSEKTIAATGVTDLGTYLTSQSLRGYVHAYNNTGTGNAVTSISIEGGTITANKGTTFLTSHQSLANYYTKGQVDTKLGKYLPLAGGTMDAGAQIQRTATGGMWYQGRSIALLRETSANGYHALWSLKTTDGSWDFGEYNSSDWNNIPVLSYVLDSNFDKGSNITTYQIKFPLASGTIALTSNILNPTNYYWANNKITSTSKIDAEVRVKNLGAGCSTTIENTIMATNWVRAMGNTGIYFQDHGGGLYMSDNTWIRTWAGKALQVDNTIRSTDFHTTYYANNVWTITSAARLENSTTLVYGTNTSSQSINTYLRGTNVTLQVKKGTSTNYNALQLTSDRINCNNYCDMKYGAAVSGGNFTVQNNAYLAQKAGAKVGIGTGSPSYTLDVRDNKMRAGGYVHFGYSSDDAVLLAGGGYAQGVPVKYWSIEFIQIFNSKLAERTTSPKGNYIFITKIEPYIDGSCKLTLQFPSGYNRDNTMIWAMGILRQGANYGDASIYATIVHSSGSEYHLNLADDATLNNGTCQLYFMCF